MFWKVIGAAGALAVSGVAAAAATWQTTLLPRDLDGNAANGPEAYYDITQDVTWLADWRPTITAGATANGQMSWSQASAWADGRSYGGLGGWRLPTASNVQCYPYDCTNTEIGRLWYTTLGNIYPTIDTRGPFTNMPAAAFWTGSVNTSEAYVFNVGSGFQSITAKSGSAGVVLVRSGDVPAVPEPATGLLMLGGVVALGGTMRRWRGQ